METKQINRVVNPSSPMDSRFHQVNVMAMTTSGMFSGVVYCQQMQRLLDALNKGFYTQKGKAIIDFIPIYDANVAVDGKPELLMDTAYIRKSDVLFVGEESRRRALYNEPMRYPLRKKKPIKAVVNLPQISLTGEMYSEMWEEFQDALIRVSQFIPMTNVAFHPPLPNGIEFLCFVAVNKDRISYVGKLQP